MRLTLSTGFLTTPFLVLLLAPGAGAKPTYLSDWLSLYPNSAAADNVINGTGSSCQLCHRDSNGGSPWNAYGWEVRQIWLGGGGITNALMQVEPNDSDVDPTASDNLAEIVADSQPGWTDGANNTVYFDDGTTDTNQPPPVGILGSLDPDSCPDTIYCGVSDGHANNTSTISIDSCVLTDFPVIKMSGGPDGQAGYLLVGDGTTVIVSPPDAKGDLCVAGGCIGRYTADVQVIGNGPNGPGELNTDLVNGNTGMGTGQLPATCGGPLIAGQTWNFQYWHRQPMAAESTFSEAITVTFR